MLDVGGIRDRLGERWAGADLRALSSVTSTSDVAWAWADAGCPEGTAVFAEEQVRGRGRFGRSWHSPRGRGILVSVVLRPPGDEVSPGHLTALGAVAVAEAIEAETPLRAGIRWPNDVVVAQASRLCATGRPALSGGEGMPAPPRKVAGVLVECRGGKADPSVIGIGINVNATRDELPAALRASASSLAIEAGHEVCREAVAAALLCRLHERLRDTVEGRWALVADAWLQRAALLGKLVTAQSQGGTFEGRLVAADPLRGIELELPGGERRRFRAEDTTLIVSGDAGRMEA